MHNVISLDEHRRHRDRTAVDRLDDAVRQLDDLVRDGHLAATVERELRAIGRAVAHGRAEAAADRAERLVAVLLHPAAAGDSDGRVHRPAPTADLDSARWIR